MPRRDGNKRFWGRTRKQRKRRGSRKRSLQGLRGQNKDRL